MSNLLSLISHRWPARFAIACAIAASLIGCGSAQRPDCGQKALESSTDDRNDRKQSTSCSRRED